jgi:ribosomal protein L29
MAKLKDQLQELKSKGAVELGKMLKASREELRDLRFKVASDQHKDIRELRDIRKRIARIMTLLQRAPAPAEKKIEKKA